MPGHEARALRRRVRSYTALMAPRPTSAAVPPERVALGFERGDSIIVTGAANGIGRATAVAAAAMGLSVAAWDLEPDPLEEAVAELRSYGVSAVGAVADVGDADQVAAALERSRSLGDIRYLVNNAGPPSSAELSFDDALLLCAGSMRRIAHSWLDGGVPAGAALVNVASVAGTTIGTSPDWYSASKAAIMGYTRHLAAYRGDEVRANAVAPGMIRTRRMAWFAEQEVGQRALARVPLGRYGEPEDIAWTILFLLSPLASYIHGAMVTVDGGWTITQ